MDTIPEDLNAESPLNPRRAEGYMRLVSRGGHFNVRKIGGDWLRVFMADVYHFLLDLPWWKVIIFSLVYWATVNLFFGLLYWADIDQLAEPGGTFADAFFFSVQTMSTIGYGNMTPHSTYGNIVVFFQAWLSFLTDAGIVSLMIGKLSRPTRLRHTLEFSEFATINRRGVSYQPPKGLQSSDQGGIYVESTDQILSFRVLNLRTRQLCNPEFNLFLIKREPDGEFLIHELDFELNSQVGRTRAVGFSSAYLPLPWTFTHRIDKHSPLFGMTRQQMLESQCEIVPIFDVVDELSSCSFQVRWSYLPSEIKWGEAFVPILSRGLDGKFEFDCTRISETEVDRHSTVSGEEIIACNPLVGGL